jgi:hypothetical protein
MKYLSTLKAFGNPVENNTLPDVDISCYGTLGKRNDDLECKIIVLAFD